MKEFLGGIAIIAAAVAAIAGLSVGSYHLYAYLAPRYEATRRDVMIDSRSYTEGTIRELYTLQRQYQAAKTDDERATLAAAARHEFSIFPAERLPPDLRVFMASIGE
jgi:hypothetical protein